MWEQVKQNWPLIATLAGVVAASMAWVWRMVVVNVFATKKELQQCKDNVEQQIEDTESRLQERLKEMEDRDTQQHAALNAKVNQVHVDLLKRMGEGFGEIKTLMIEAHKDN